MSTRQAQARRQRRSPPQGHLADDPLGPLGGLSGKPRSPDPVRLTEGPTSRKWLHRPLVSVLLGLALLAHSAAAREKLERSKVSLPMPGAPAQVVATDMNDDGLKDLVIVVAYTEWDQLEFSEVTEMEDVSGLVEVLTVVPSLFDRRELHIFGALKEGGYTQLTPPYELPTSVLSLEAGPSMEVPLIAFTDDGMQAVSLKESSQAEVQPDVLWTPLYSAEHVAAKTGSFIPGLQHLHDLDGDQQQDDVVFPAPEGLHVLLNISVTPITRAHSKLIYPPADDENPHPLSLDYPLPRVEDVDGDQLLDLLLEFEDGEQDRLFVFRNRGEGRFSRPFYPLRSLQEPKGSRTEEEGDQASSPPLLDRLVHFGDLDGDGQAEAVTFEDLSDDDAGIRKDIQEAKNPPIRYSLHRTREDLSIIKEPYSRFDTLGYAFGGDSSVQLPGGLQDLNHDGRVDLVAMTLDFSLFQAMRVLTSHSIKIGMDFRVYCQQESGNFKYVPATDLSGVFRFDLDNLRIGRLAQFAGDFDGDQLPDFAQLGRGKTVSIHRGQPGCRYPERADLEIILKEEPLDLGLFQVRDLDGDGLADLMVTQPQTKDDPDETSPARLDLYLSRSPQ